MTISDFGLRSADCAEAGVETNPQSSMRNPQLTIRGPVSVLPPIPPGVEAFAFVRGGVLHLIDIMIPLDETWDHHVWTPNARRLYAALFAVEWLKRQEYGFAARWTNLLGPIDEDGGAR